MLCQYGKSFLEPLLFSDSGIQRRCLDIYIKERAQESMDIVLNQDHAAPADHIDQGAVRSLCRHKSACPFPMAELIYKNCNPYNYLVDCMQMW